NIVNFFNEGDINRGFIESTDRNGNITLFSITSLSIAGLYGNFNTFTSCHSIAQLASKIKKEAKNIKGSSKVIKLLD
ncbi:MAG: histidine kinase, partial [Clostridiaceae bacterium]